MLKTRHLPEQSIEFRGVGSDPGLGRLTTDVDFNENAKLVFSMKFHHRTYMFSSDEDDE